MKFLKLRYDINSTSMYLFFKGKLAKLQGLVVQMLHNKGSLSNARISDTLLSKDYQNSEDNVNHSNDIQPHLHGATVMNGLSKYPEGEN